MIGRIFGLIVLTNGTESVWIEITDDILPLWREEQFRKRREKVAATEEPFV